MPMPVNIGKKIGMTVLNVTWTFAWTWEPVTHGAGQLTLLVTPVNKLAAFSGSGRSGPRPELDQKRRPRTQG